MRSLSIEYRVSSIEYRVSSIVARSRKLSESDSNKLLIPEGVRDIDTT